MILFAIAAILYLIWYYIDENIDDWEWLKPKDDD